MRSVEAAVLLMVIVTGGECNQLPDDGCHCHVNWSRVDAFCYHLQKYNKEKTSLDMDKRCHWTESELGENVVVNLPVLHKPLDHQLLLEWLTDLRRETHIPSMMIDLSFDTTFNRTTHYNNSEAWKWRRGDTLADTRFSKWKDGRPTPIEDNQFVSMDEQGDWLDVPEDYYRHRRLNDSLQHYYVCQTECVSKPNKIIEPQTTQNNNIQALLIIVCVTGGLLALLVGISIAVCHEKRRTRREREEEEQRRARTGQLSNLVQQHLNDTDPTDDYFVKSPAPTEPVPTKPTPPLIATPQSPS